MSWIGIVNIDGELVAEKVVASEEEARQKAEKLLEKILQAKTGRHGLAHFRARKVTWSNGWMSDEKPYYVNLSRVCRITTIIGRSNKAPG